MSVSFGPVSALMESSYDLAKAEYFRMLTDHVGEQLARSSQFVNISLKLKMCIDRFAPKERN